MYIDLTWVNMNNVNVTLEIYRGDEPLDRDNLPETPIVTIDDGGTRYRDTDVELGKTYYYVFVTISDTDSHVSVNYPIRAINRRGVGPQDIIDGDANLGYFGTVASGQFLSTNELKEKTGLTDGTVYQPFPIWHKFIRNNKILFIPHTPIVESITFNQLWNAGLVYGTDVDTNPFISAQKKVITIGADQYIVRLMTGFRDGEYAEWDNNIQTSNEFDDLVYPLAHSVMDKQKLNNITTNGIKWVEFFPNGTAGVLTQEAVSATTVTSRGGVRATNNDDAAYDMRSFYDTRASNITRVTAGYRWWPVLELIEVKPDAIPDPEPEEPEVPTTSNEYDFNMDMKLHLSETEEVLLGGYGGDHLLGALSPEPTDNFGDILEINWEYRTSELTSEDDTEIVVAASVKFAETFNLTIDSETFLLSYVGEQSGIHTWSAVVDEANSSRLPAQVEGSIVGKIEIVS